MAWLEHCSRRIDRAEPGAPSAVPEDRRHGRRGSERTGSAADAPVAAGAWIQFALETFEALRALPLDETDMATRLASDVNWRR